MQLIVLKSKHPASPPHKEAQTVLLSWIHSICHCEVQYCSAQISSKYHWQLEL